MVAEGAENDELVDGLAELSALADREELAEQLRRLTEICAATMAGVNVAGITLMKDGAADTVAVTDEKVLAIDRRQYRDGDGPCLDALRHRRVVRADNEAEGSPWPGFASEARAIGVLSFLAAPILIGDESAGSLNLYGLEVGAFEELDERPVALFAGQAATIIAHERGRTRLQQLVEQLSSAMASRAVIEQAKGVVMVQQGIDATAAFAALRQLSQRRNEKLALVAQRIVDGVRR
jgi:GAF domain-containing protein